MGFRCGFGFRVRVGLRVQGKGIGFEVFGDTDRKTKMKKKKKKGKAEKEEKEQTPCVRLRPNSTSAVVKIEHPLLWTGGSDQLGSDRFHTTARELQTWISFRARAFKKHHQNSTKGPPKEGRKKDNCCRRGEKSAKFRAPHPSRPPLGLHPPPTRWPKAALAQTGQA